ncbi:possible transcriptional regulator [Rhodococcus wratislaviensis]|uniref:Possible transcriptional regulator n=1 Tax=Rhodococcus wratislaviensis TaxID=44752 RepID=A0A402C2I5_RHOWR|nr:possible transcriptional regulator [Rhodococcus wratislaviensis]
MDEESDTRGLRRNFLPRNRQRERVLRMVREHEGAVDAVELASQLGVHVSTVRFHLDALCDDGAITRTRMNRPGAGRPRTGYLVIEERVDYRTLADVLAMELGQTVQTRARRAEHAGHEWATRMAASRSAGAGDGGHTPESDAGDALDHAAARTTNAFARMGFGPELVSAPGPSAPSSADSGGPAGERERIIRLHACPVRDLARSHPEVVCGVHRGLLQGLLDTAATEGNRKPQRPAISAHLEPFVEPELCVARLVAG